MKLRINLFRRGTLFLAATTLVWSATAKEPDAARVQEIAGWLTPHPIAVGAPVGDRIAWQTLAARLEFADVIEKAARLKREPLPSLPDSLFLDYSRTGNRDHWQKVAFERRGRLQTYTLAECLENKGYFIAPLEELIAALCAEKTWVYPAHDGSLKNFHGETVDIDLGASMLGWQLATADCLLGDKLSPETRALIRENLQRRIFTPYRAAVRGTRPEFWWMKGDNNWNAVCLAGVTGTALASLDSPQDRAWFIAVAEDYIRHFLSGFTPDGYCSEGVGYWNYGFGHFVMLSETIRRSTGGKLDLLAWPTAAKPALFGARTEILAGIYPSIADCSPGTRPDGRLMQFLSRRFGFTIQPGSTTDPDRLPGQLYETLIYATAPRNLPRIPTTLNINDLPWRTWFPNGGVLICRPGPDGNPTFAACLKGGNNNENHNHNDVGTFMVVSGRTMLICDPGAEVYTRRTFSSHRYDSKVLSSFGHAVPVIAGKLQRSGAKARGVVLQAHFTPAQDTLKLDLRSTYNVPELKRLEREFVFQRGAHPALTVTDTVEFLRPSTYESALITWGKWQRVSPSELRISEGRDAIVVEIESGSSPVELTAETLDEDVHTPKQPVRLGLKLPSPIKQGRFKLTIIPDK